jgi:hypothetical protein
MSGIVKKTGNFAEKTIKSFLSAVFTEIATELVKETALTESMKSSVADVGVKVVKEMGIDPRKIQKEILKAAIKKELNL